ncbi:MAG: (Fe-S)-binding protein [bacterium]|nr:(Fe-S)-binding protein [bacterium]
MNKQELVENIYTCASCGYCRFGCPVFSEIGFERFTARGRMLIFKRILEGKFPYTEDVFRSIYMCSQCANCEEICPTGINFIEIIDALKIDLAREGKLPESQKAMREIVREKSNPFGEAREERGAWLPKDYQVKESEALYFVGCAASYSLNRTSRSVMKILEKVKFDFTTLGNLEYCCGEPLFRMGEIGLGNELVEKNSLEFERLGVKTIFASCPGCLKNLKHKYPPEFRVLHTVQLFSELIKEGRVEFGKELNQRVIYHDGCDIGRHVGIYEEPREILQSIPGVELLEFDYNREEAICCGGPLVSQDPGIAKKIASRRVEEAVEKGADVIVTTCPTCFVNFKDGAKLVEGKVDIQEISQLLLKLLKK